MRDKILGSYDNNRSLYDDFRLKAENLLIELLKLGNIRPHLIVSRTKTRDSLSKKIDQSPDKYSVLEDITDIVGIRIITYFESEIDLIAAIVEQEFDIDRGNSIDKRKLKADQFGYKSLHYVVSIITSRCNFPEYKKFQKLKAEIQIRSILQHAWAEIEHDLGYKGEHSIPDPLRRSFSRISALLETSDIEFDRLRRELTKYEDDIKTLIKTNPQDIELNQASILSFLITNETIKECKQIAKDMDVKFIKTRDVGVIIKKYEFFNIKTIKQLEDSLNYNKSMYLKFFQEYLKETSVKILPDSLPLFFYLHFLSALKENPNYILEYFNYGDIKIDSENNSHLKILNTYQKVKNTP